MPDDEQPKCFIAMPITTPEDRVADYDGQTEHFRQVMEALFVPAIEAAGYEAIRPEFKGSAMIQPAIVRNLIEAPLVLCDMSILNANVFFELGVRSALNKPVAMVRDHLTPTIPFDIASVGAHQYDGMLSGWRLDTERLRLTEHLKDTAAHGEHNELWRYFGVTQFAEAPPAGTAMESVEALLTELLAEMRTGTSDRSIPEALHATVNERRYLNPGRDRDDAGRLLSMLSGVQEVRAIGPSVLQVQVVSDGSVRARSKTLHHIDTIANEFPDLQIAVVYGTDD